MIPQFNHDLISSFVLWIDDVLIRQNECVETGKSQIFTYSDSDPDLPSSLVAYYSSDRQFSPENAHSGVYVGGIFTPQNTTGGPIIDFDKGRILFDSTSGDSLSVSGNFDRKEINVYLSPDDEEWTILNKEFNINGESFLKTVGGEGFPRFTIPAIFVLDNSSEITPFALGGEKCSENKLRVIIFTTNNYEHVGVKSIMENQYLKTFNVFSFEDYPFAQFGSLKEFPYSYTGFVDDNAPTHFSYIEKVRTYNLSDVVKKNIGLANNIKIGFADFDVSTYRGTIP